MSRPELEFEFDRREFLRDEVRPTPPSRTRAMLKHVTFAGLVVVAIMGVFSLYGDAKNYITNEDGVTSVIKAGLINVPKGEQDVQALAADEVIDHAIAILAEDSGMLRTRHGGRLVALYGRGVAAVEVAPQGPIL